MSNQAELDLAEEAIRSGVTGCYEWDDKAADRIRSDSCLLGLKPEYIRRRLREFILDGGRLQQKVEGRPDYSHREYWYMAIIPEPGFKNGIFVELELTDKDPELPCVVILNAHPERR